MFFQLLYKGADCNQNHYVFWMSGGWVAQSLLYIMHWWVAKKNAGFQSYAIIE